MLRGEREQLHILNGEAMYNYLQQEGQDMKNVIPFNEAMCEGNVVEDIFSWEFFKQRALVHQVSEEQYKEITVQPLKKLLQEEFKEIILWFDTDMFCQMNVLTLLAYLEQINYTGKVVLNIIDQQYNVVEREFIQLENYQLSYKEVLIEKKAPTNQLIGSIVQGVKHYLELQKDTNELTAYIKANDNLSEKQLVNTLLSTFKVSYGLGDIQYTKWIKKVRGE